MPRCYIVHSALDNNNCSGLVLASLTSCLKVAQTNDYSQGNRCIIHRCSSHRISVASYDYSIWPHDGERGSTRLKIETYFIAYCL